MSSDEDLLQSVKIVLIEKCNLEKENTELKKQLEDFTRAYTLTVDKSVIREQELEKENAELKTQIKDLCESLDIMNKRESELLEEIIKLQAEIGDIMSNILNKGRCSRCIASEQKEKVIESSIVCGVELVRVRNWKWCNKHGNWCRYISRNCKESPMGIKI